MGGFNFFLICKYPILRLDHMCGLQVQIQHFLDYTKCCHEEASLKNVKIPEWMSVMLGSPWPPTSPHLKAPQETHILVTLFSASPASALSMRPCKKYFSHPSFGYFLFFFFSTSPRTHNNWNWDSKIGGGLLIANYLDQSVRWGQSEILSSSQVLSITLFSFLQVHNIAVPSFTSRCKLRNHAEPKPISWAKPASLNFSSSICIVQDDHILYYSLFFSFLFFSAGAQWCCAFVPATAKVCNYAEPKTNFLSQTGMFWLCLIQCC